MHPVGRLGVPDDIAGLVLWLASDEAGFVSGSVFAIDGGAEKLCAAGQATLMTRLP